MDKNGILVLLTKVFFVIALIALIFSGFKSKNDENRKTFGRKIDGDLYIFTHEPLLNIGNKSLDLEVLGISQSDFTYFKSPPDYFFTDYPQNPPFDRSDWNIIHWNITPVDTRYDELISFALDTSFSPLLSENSAYSISRYFSLMNGYLQEEGNYYAIRYKINDDNLKAAHLFIVAPEHKNIFRLKRGN